MKEGIQWVIIIALFSWSCENQAQIGTCEQLSSIVESIAQSEGTRNYCVDRQTITPLYHQLRLQSKYMTHWLSDECNLPDKIYESEKDVDRFIRGLENGVVLRSEARCTYMENTPCEITIYLSTNNNGFVYALAVNTKYVKSRNEKVVLFEGVGSAYLYNIKSDCNPRCDYVVSKKVTSFVPIE